MRYLQTQIYHFPQILPQKSVKGPNQIVPSKKLCSCTYLNFCATNYSNWIILGAVHPKIATLFIGRKGLDGMNTKEMQTVFFCCLDTNFTFNFPILKKATGCLILGSYISRFLKHLSKIIHFLMLQIPLGHPVDRPTIDDLSKKLV